MHAFIDQYAIVTLHALLLPALLLQTSNRRWQIAECFLAMHCLSSIALLVFTLSVSSSEYVGGWFQTSGLSLTMLTLISFIGLIVLRYARQNLAGDPDNGRFLTWYLLTLLAVCVVITSNHLALFAMAWAAISLSLHQLLLFYPERPRAMLAAHKKFLFARCSELMLMTAFVLLYFQHHTTDISLILGYYHTQPILSATDHIVALLLCCVALIKCAQLPLHGWLIQVVESPTPVSALLHAGIINLGGFLLLLFAPLLSLAIFAQWLLLVVAGLSCVVAALVMMTRISIKVRLAWSTIAQMGLMLIECALGLYELALLHLLAHSCYKAHAFLVSGEAVNHYLRKRYVQADLPNAMHWFAAACCVTAVSFVLIIARGLPVLWSPWILIAIAVLSMLAFHFQSNSAGLSWRAIWIAVLGVMVYTVAGQLTHQLVPTVSVPQAYADAWVSLLFISLFWLFLLIQYAPHGPTQRRWFIALNAGFYLDEWSTRATLYLWPISLPATQSKNVALSQSTNVINSNEVK